MSLQCTSETIEHYILIHKHMISVQRNVLLLVKSNVGFSGNHSSIPVFYGTQCILWTMFIICIGSTHVIFTILSTSVTMRDIVHKTSYFYSQTDVNM